MMNIYFIKNMSFLFKWMSPAPAPEESIQHGIFMMKNNQCNIQQFNLIVWRIMQCLAFNKCIILFKQYQKAMNFLNFLTSGAGIFNFNLQNMSLNTNPNTFLRTIPQNLISPQENTQQTQKPRVSDSELHQPANIIKNFISTSQTQLLSHQQQLINQYMHLNIQLLSHKIQNLEHQPEKKEQVQVPEAKSNKKKIKKFNENCGHSQRQHYAKGMCNNCYHKSGRTKKPWKCQHQKLYANGLCQNCYINKYNKMKRQKVSCSDIMNSQLQESKIMNSQAKIEEAQ